MSRKFRGWAIAFSIAVVVAACGGDNSGSTENDAGSGSQDQGASSDDGGSASGDVATPTIDPAAMPPAGEAHVEVNGQTFVFKQSEMLDGPFACEIRDNGITINFQSDRHDMLLQGATQPDGATIARTTVVPEESESRYSSSGGGTSVEAPYVLYEGSFDETPKDDLASFTDVGTGTVAVTCP